MEDGNQEGQAGQHLVGGREGEDDTDVSIQMWKIGIIHIILIVVHVDNYYPARIK